MFVLIYFQKIQKVEFALVSLHFFFAVKQKPLFDKLDKTKELLLTVFWEKNIKQEMNTHFLWDFFCYEWETDVNNTIKKNQNKVCLTKDC